MVRHPGLKPARFSFTHGGKDVHPFPVPIKVYDETIETLQNAVQKSKLDISDKNHAIKITELVIRAEQDFTPKDNLRQLIKKERENSWKYDGRTVFGDAKPPKSIRKAYS